MLNYMHLTLPSVYEVCAALAGLPRPDPDSSAGGGGPIRNASLDVLLATASVASPLLLVALVDSFLCVTRLFPAFEKCGVHVPAMGAASSASVSVTGAGFLGRRARCVVGVGVEATSGKAVGCDKWGREAPRGPARHPRHVSRAWRR
jgi:hypothetical protein